MITSTQNPKIKEIRGLQARSKTRRAAGAFVVEGVRLAEEALQAGWQPQLVIYTEDLNERGLALVEAWQSQSVAVEAVSDHVMAAASDTQTPQGILLVLPMQIMPTPDQLDFALILDQMRDPGNLGTLLRTAAAAGAGAIFLPPGTVDVYAPKVIRSAMGAHFHLSIQALTWEAIEAQCKLYSLQVFLAAAGNGTPYTQADFSQPLALLIGGEAHGAGQHAHHLATTAVHIPMPGTAESLNAAVAAAILTFEVVRQRTQ
ncbi:MAG: RNA methyltransferase [Anaerolineales bacterium]|nr:RNA methyltransferase [Anaerolineales bacterium]